MIFSKLYRLRQRVADDELVQSEELVPSDKFEHIISPQELRAERLTLSISGKVILKNINVRFPSNKITCIIGPSGCGKSTLLRSLNRLTDYIDRVKVEGDIKLGERSILNCSQSELIELRRRVGLVPQRPTPLPMSIFQNVVYGCKINGTRGRRRLRLLAEHYLSLVGLWEEVKGRLSEPASRLSIGQQQRLSLARSLAVEPEYILADEVTSALDPISSKRVEELFIKLKERYSIIMVTHTLRQARSLADHIVFIYMGEIIEEGSAADFFNFPKNELTRNYISGVVS